MDVIIEAVHKVVEPGLEGSIFDSHCFTSC
jgi:hypothetical protein